MSLPAMSSEAAWLPGWQFVVGAIIVILLKIAYDVAKKKMTLLTSRFGSENMTTLTSTSVPVRQLTEHNFSLWERELTERLEKEGLSAAIESPLPTESKTNKRAYTRILGGVPDDLQHEINNTESAYQAYQQLRAAYGGKSQERQRKLEKEITGMKLKSFDDKSVDVFIRNFRTAVSHLTAAGGEVEVTRFRSLLAGTLPDNDDQVVNCAKLNIETSDTQREAVERFKASCKRIQVTGGRADDLSQIARFRRGGFQNNWRRADHQGRPTDRPFTRVICYNCGEPGHFARACPKQIEMERKKEEEEKRKKEEEVIKKNKNLSVYSCTSTSGQATVCVDSGTNAHHLPSPSLFHDIDYSRGGVVTMANGHQSPVLGIGDAVVSSSNGTLSLPDARFTPDFENGLISVSKLTDEGYTVIFDKEKAVVTRDRMDDQLLHVVISFPRNGDLYQTGASITNDLSFAAMSSAELHSAWGHPGKKATEKLKKKFPTMNFEFPEFCETCVLGKQQQLPYRSTENTSYQPLEVIHTDICESKCRGFDGSWYIVTFVDEYSKYAEIFTLKDKSAASVLKSFKDFQTRLERQLGTKIRKVRSDNGREFLGDFESYLKESGIQHQFTVPYRHQQNGTAERFNQTLMAKARCLMIESCMPEKFWPLAAKTACLLYNLSPHSSIKFVEPVKRLFPETRTIIERGGQLHVFGSAAYRHIPQERRNFTRASKLAPIAEKLVFVGYDSLDSDIYLLLSQKTGAVMRERNVVVTDGVFPFCGKTEDCQCQCPIAQPELPRQEEQPATPFFYMSIVHPSGGDETENGRVDKGQVEEVVESVTESQEQTEPKTLLEPTTEVVVTSSTSNPTHEHTTSPTTTSPLPPTTPASLPTPSPVVLPTSSTSKSNPDDEISNPTSSTSLSDPEITDTPCPSTSPDLDATPTSSTSKIQHESTDEEETSPPQQHRMVLRDRSTLRRPLRYGDEPVTKANSVFTKLSNEPTSYEEAMSSQESEYWREACNKEMSSMLKNEVFEEVPETRDLRVISSKWVFKRKMNAAGAVTRHKARLVAQGYVQRFNVDYWETYAPTVAATTLRTFLTVCKLKRLRINQVDVTTAFLYGDIDGEIYLRPPTAYSTPGQVWRLRKSIYGLKQSPKCWSHKLNAILEKQGFYPTKSDRCLFVRGDATTNQAYILVYVDDCLIAAQTDEELATIKQELKKDFEIQDLGKLGMFIGVEFKETGKNILAASQRRYIDELSERFNVTDAHTRELLPVVNPQELENEPIDETIPYRSIVGGLLYIASMTRPDISAPVSYLSRFLDKPSRKAWKQAKQVLNYLRHTKHRSLLLGERDQSSLVTYADANFAPAGDRKSQSGAVFQLAGSTVGWLSKKQKTVSTSTTEAEYIALSLATNETLWLQHLLEEMGVDVVLPTTIYEDNQPAISIATNQRNPGLAKHLDVKLHAVSDYHQKGFIKVSPVASKNQLADGLTKVINDRAESSSTVGPRAVIYESLQSSVLAGEPL
ncbi:hypothetical protein TYRP_005538 [Tyrophagus putrescentiae]|nr:hypothetical protein TYRP_005538 [Tyrophagus putrescentiae]